MPPSVIVGLIAGILKAASARRRAETWKPKIRSDICEENMKSAEPLAKTRANDEAMKKKVLKVWENIWTQFVKRAANSRM